MLLDGKNKAFKKLAMRWHPGNRALLEKCTELGMVGDADKFGQKFGNCLNPEEKDKIMEQVKEIFQLIQQTTSNLGF